MFHLDVQVKKSQLIEKGHFQTKNVKLPVYKDGDVFAAFKGFDLDNNGFLEWAEYHECLSKLTNLDLKAE